MTAARLTLARGLALMSVALGTAGCAPSHADPRGWHVVDDDIVTSRPVSSVAYEAFIRGELALRREPAQPSLARRHFADALALSPRDARLWSALAEALWLEGDEAQARVALDRALELDGALQHARELRETMDREPVDREPVDREPACAVDERCAPVVTAASTSSTP